MSSPIIGFIGLGLMGSGFTQRLTAKGYEVHGFDVVPEKCQKAAEWGVKPAGSPADLARNCDIVLSCVMTIGDLETALFGPDGLVSGKPARCRQLVDHSTLVIADAKRVAARLQEGAIAFVDAPVSGGPDAARAGTLAIMAGGAADTISAVSPVMRDLGRFTHMGDVGAGQATKLVNQTLVLSNYCVIAEAMALAEAYGIDVAKVPEALASGHAGSNLLPVLFERMEKRDFAPRGYVRQVLKDLEMLSSAAMEQHVPMPMSGQALTLFRMLVAQGKSELDGAAVLSLITSDAAD